MGTTTHKIMKLSNRQKFTLHQQITDYARQLGFDIVGFSPAKIEEKYLKIFERWLENGNVADMEYMRKIEQRRDMNKILPGAKSVIVLGMNYYHEQAPLKRGHGRIARYAYGRDYHKIIGKKLKMVEKFIARPLVHTSPAKAAHSDFLPKRMAKESHLPSDSPPRGGLLTKSYVDTGPLMERALAEQAGIGRTGKNGCLITEKFGSWIFLSEIITTVDLNFKNTSTVSLHPHDRQKVSPVTLFAANSMALSTVSNRWSSTSNKPFNICGNCIRCMAACPTGAIIAPGIVDSRLCISYLTIENRKKIPQKLAKIIKKTKRLFGCDICQEVCPHNQARLRASKAKELFNPKIAGNSLDLQSLPLTDAQFLKTFAGSPLMRTKRKGLQRTAKELI